MSTAERAQFTIDLDKIHLVNDATGVLNELYHATITFTDKTVEDGKQCIEIEAGSDEELSLAQDYLHALCHPVETTIVDYPAELHGVMANMELRSRIERESKVALHYQEPGKISVRGNDPIAVTMACSMIEDAISEYFNKTSMHVSDISQTSALDNTIKNILLEELRAKQKKPSCTKNDEFETEYGEFGKTDQTENCISEKKADNDPGKYLEEFALSRGYDEKMIESIFAYLGRDVKFETFYRALKGIITIPQTVINKEH